MNGDIALISNNSLWYACAIHNSTYQELMYHVGDASTGTINFAYSVIKATATVNPRIAVDSAGRAIITFSNLNCKSFL